MLISNSRTIIEDGNRKEVITASLKILDIITTIKVVLTTTRMVRK